MANKLIGGMALALSLAILAGCSSSTSTKPATPTSTGDSKQGEKAKKSEVMSGGPDAIQPFPK
jgi:outer membrane biogenesis lipoprotein LolB